jgi:hypothetical protein
MNLSNTSRDTPEDAARVAQWLRSNGLKPPKPSAEIIDHPARRRPLFTGPIEGGDDSAAEREPQHIVKRDTAGRPSIHAALSAKDRERPASAGWTAQLLDVVANVTVELHDEAVGEINNLQDRLVAKFEAIEAERRAERAEQAAVIAELRSEISQMRSIQEAARVTSRGEEGREGPRGIPGPPGPSVVGPQGPRGEIGPTA